MSVNRTLKIVSRARIFIGFVPDFGAMKVDPKFVILKHMGETASMATCARCHIKFFTPLELIKHPLKAVENLHDQFSRHKCVPDKQHE